jgi:hypothetical protein
MRQSVIMLLASLAGILGGAALIGTWALGLALIFDSLCVGVFALLRDDPAAGPQVHQVPTLRDVLERARAS